MNVSPSHTPFATTLHKELSYISLYFGFFEKKKEKKIMRDKMIPGHMDKDNKN